MSASTNELSDLIDPISMLSPPAWLAAGALADDEWLVRTDDPKKRRQATFTLRFDVAVAFGSIRLTSAGRENDLVTAKLYMYYALTGPTAWITSAAAARRELSNLLLVIQWRLERGLERNSDISRLWFRDFLRSLQADGLEGLLHSEQRIARALESFEDAPPLRKPVKGDNRPWLNMGAIYDRAGLTNHLQLSPAAQKLVSDFSQRHQLWSGTQSRKAGRRLKVPDERSTTDRRAQTFARYFGVWYRLAQLRPQLAHDPIGFDAFPRGVRAQLGRAAGGSPLGRTKTIPPAQVTHLVDRALRWVWTYSDVLLSIATQLAPEDRDPSAQAKPFAPRLAKALKAIDHRAISSEAPASPWPFLPSYRRSRAAPDSKMAFGDALYRLLPAACVIVIAAFSARRKGELESLRDDCISDDESGLWLHSFISKSSRDIERIPTCESVRRAVDVLRFLSSQRRKMSGESWLLEFSNLNYSRKVVTNAGFQLARDMNYFAKHAEVPALPDGTSWQFAPHQFRRFFAICYFYRFRDASLTALTHYFRHADPRQTRAYITAAAAGGFVKMADEQRSRRADSLAARARLSDFNAVQVSFSRETLADVAKGKASLAGFGGVRLAAALQDQIASLRVRIEVASSAEEFELTMDKLLSKIAHGTPMEPHPVGHSYCLCRSTVEDTAIAECAKAARAHRTSGSALGADHRYSEDLVCSRCPHNLQLPENEPYWRSKAQEWECLAETAGGALRLLASSRAEAARAHLVRCFGVSGADHEGA